MEPALLLVEISIPFDGHIRPVTLPGQTDIYFPPYDVYAIATGYYSDEPNHLQQLNMKVEQTYEAEDFGVLFVTSDIGELDDGSLCNDEGVPLVLNNDKKTLIGISARLPQNIADCRDRGRLNVFVDVKRYVEWITETINITTTGLAFYRDYPYHAHIEVYNSTDFNTNNCSGAVIEEFFVITSKDCVSDGTRFRIRLNMDPEGDDPTFDIPSNYTPFIPPWTPDSSPLQPALIRLSIGIGLNRIMKAVKLPEPENNYIVSNKHAIATIYADRPNDEIGKRLEWLNMYVIPAANCTEHFNATLLPNSLCVQSTIRYYNYGSLCKDQGVPLVLKNEDTNILLGISTRVTNQETCKDGGHINLFIDVKPYLGWINQVLTVHEHV